MMHNDFDYFKNTLRMLTTSSILVYENYMRILNFHNGYLIVPRWAKKCKSSHKSNANYKFKKLESHATKMVVNFTFFVLDVVKLKNLDGRNDYSWISHKVHICNFCQYFFLLFNCTFHWICRIAPAMQPKWLSFSHSFAWRGKIKDLKIQIYFSWIYH